MARDPLYGVTLHGWDGLSSALEANSQDFQELEAHRQQLVSTRDQVREAAAEQALHAAAKQDASKRLQQKLGDGRKLATFLRNAVRQRYGNRSEKLVEFGLQPFRSRRRTTQPSETKPPGGDPPTPQPE
jgi:hypothetical protein